MYLSTERVAPYPIPAQPDITSIRKKAARVGRKLLIAALGREFMGLRTRHKVYALYGIVSLMALATLWSEEAPLLMIPIVVNAANAVRLVNQIVEPPSARG